MSSLLEPGMCVGAFQEPLYLHLIADLPLSQSNHMSFIENNETHVTEQRWLISKSEVQLLRCCHNDVAGTERIDLEVTCANTAVKGRYTLAQWTEGPAPRPRS